VQFKSRQISFLFVYIILGLWVAYTFIQSEETDEIVLSIGAGTEEIRFIKKLISEYEQKNPTVKIKLNTLSSPTDQQHHYYITTLGAGTKSIDVLRIDTIWLAEFASAKWIEPLDSYINARDRKAFIPVIEKTNIYKGRLYAIPWNINVGLFYYRKDLLEKYSFALPSTWNELINVCKKISAEEDTYGYLWQGKQYEGLICNFIEFIGGNNGEIIDDQGNIVLNSEQNKKALELMRDLIWKYEVSPPNTYSELMEESSRHLFQQGKSLFLRNWTYVWDLCQEDEFLKDKVGVALLPKFKNGTNSSVCGGWHLAVNAYSQKKKEAWDLVQFLTSSKVQKELAGNLSWAPTRRSLYHSQDLIEKLPFLPLVEQSLRNIHIRPNVPYYQWISDILQKYLNKVISGQLDVGDALETIQKKLERIQDEFSEA